jgi:hypothetical protein
VELFAWKCRFELERFGGVLDETDPAFQKTLDEAHNGVARQFAESAEIRKVRADQEAREKFPRGESTSHDGPAESREDTEGEREKP